MFTIVRLTFREAYRKKIFLLTLLLSLAFLILYGLGFHYVAQDLNRMKAHGGQQLVVQQLLGNQLLGAGYYFASFLMALLSLLVSVGSIASEIENGLLHAIVSKPIKRRDIVLGKYLGYSLIMVFYALALFTGILLINLHYNAGALTLLTLPAGIFAALIFLLQPLVLLGVALVFSTMFRTMAAGIVAVMLYGLGTVGGFLEQIGNLIAKTTLINTGILISLVIPTDALFRKLLFVITGNATNPLSSLSAGPFGVSVPPSNAMLVYTCFYILACIGLAVYNFSRKDL